MSRDLITPEVAKIAGITHHDLRQLVRRGHLAFPSQEGRHEKDARVFSRLGLYEVVILAELHRAGLPWPKAAEVFHFFAYPLINKETGKGTPGVVDGSASERRAVLLDYRETEDPAFLIYYFHGSMQAIGTVVARGYSAPPNVFPRSMGDAIEEIHGRGCQTVSVMNLTALLVRADTILAAMED